MKIKTLFLVLMVAFSFLGCEKETRENLIYYLNEPDVLTPDDYEIYNLIANPYTPKLERIFIGQKTTYVPLDTNELRKIEGFDEVLIINYSKEKYISKYLDEDSFSNENNVLLIPANENDREIFDQIYGSPSGRFISNIGYNAERTEAIAGAIDRMDCTMFYYSYYFRKENNKWWVIGGSIYGITCN